MFVEPKKQQQPDSASSHQLIWHRQNDLTSHEFINEIKAILTNYLDKRKEHQKEQQALKDSGWNDYLRHISWIDNEPQLQTKP